MYPKRGPTSIHNSSDNNSTIIRKGAQSRNRGTGSQPGYTIWIHFYIIYTYCKPWADKEERARHRRHNRNQVLKRCDRFPFVFGICVHNSKGCHFSSVRNFRTNAYLSNCSVFTLEADYYYFFQNKNKLFKVWKIVPFSISNVNIENLKNCIVPSI